MLLIHSYHDYNSIEFNFISNCLAFTNNHLFILIRMLIVCTWTVVG